MHRPLPAPILLAILAGCLAPAPRAPVMRHDPRVAEVIAMAADQVRRCYRAPRVPHEGRQIVTVLAVRYAPDGSLAALPEVAVQRGVTPDAAPYAEAMAQAASAAVIRCAPLRLPAELYEGGWKDFELTFSPKAIA